MAHVGEKLALGAVGFFGHSFGGVEFILCAFALGDVLHRARHAYRLPACIRQRFALHENHPLPFIREQEPDFDAAGLPLFQRKPQHLGHRIPVLGMHPVDQMFIRRRDSPPGKTKDAVDFIGPNEPVRHNIPIPTAKMRDALRLGHAPLADGDHH